MTAILTQVVDEKRQFLAVIKEQLEYQRFQLLLKINDMQYAVNSINTQILEVNKNLEDMKYDTKVEPKVVNIIQPKIHYSFLPHQIKARFQSKCEKCEKMFNSKKLLKDHIYELHAF